jgi:hypothetical protein
VRRCARHAQGQQPHQDGEEHAAVEPDAARSWTRPGFDTRAVRPEARAAIEVLWPACADRREEPAMIRARDLRTCVAAACWPEPRRCARARLMPRLVDRGESVRDAAGGQRRCLKRIGGRQRQRTRRGCTAAAMGRPLATILGHGVK